MTIVEDAIFGIDDTEDTKQPDTIPENADSSSFKRLTKPQTPLTYHLCRTMIRVAVVALIVVTSIAIPDFDRVISLAGSALCYAISVVLPLLFHVRVLDKELSRAEKAFDYTLIAVCSVLAILGTATAIMS